MAPEDVVGSVKGRVVRRISTMQLRPGKATATKHSAVVVKGKE